MFWVSKQTFRFIAGAKLLHRLGQLIDWFTAAWLESGETEFAQIQVVEGGGNGSDPYWGWGDAEQDRDRECAGRWTTESCRDPKSKSVCETYKMELRGKLQLTPQRSKCWLLSTPHAATTDEYLTRWLVCTICRVAGFNILIRRSVSRQTVIILCGFCRPHLSRYNISFKSGSHLVVSNVNLKEPISGVVESSSVTESEISFGPLRVKP